MDETQRRRFAQSLDDYSDVLGDQVDTMYLGCGVMAYLIPGIVLAFFAWLVGASYLALAPSIAHLRFGGEEASVTMRWLGIGAYVHMALTIAATTTLVLANSAAQGACSDRQLGRFHRWLVSIFGLRGTRVSYNRRVLSIWQRQHDGPLTQAVIGSIIPGDVVTDLQEEITAAQRGASIQLERTPPPATLQRLYRSAPWLYGLLFVSLVVIAMVGLNVLAQVKTH